jgi:hypothetical protein
MPKEAAVGSSQGGLVYLKYTFKYRSQFDEPNNDWLDVIDATSDELLGAYSRAKDDAMTAVFGGREKKRLNRVFEVIGFVYPDYSYPSRMQGKKRRAATSAISITPKPKRVKVLTHRPKCTETAEEPRLAKGSSAVESSHPTTIKARVESAEEPNLKIEAEQPKTLSSLQEVELPKVQKIASITPKRRRMASVLDAVMESTRALTPASVEAPNVEGENIKESAEVGMTRVVAEVGPSAPAKARPSEAIEKGAETRPSDAAKASVMLEKEKAIEGSESPTPGVSTKELEFIVCHASGKKLSKEQIAETQHYARDLQYPRGSLVYGGDDEDDFLYCLPDNKEIHVCQEMADNIGYPKFELGLSAMTKDQLADSVAYNTLKV